MRRFFESLNAITTHLNGTHTNDHQCPHCHSTESLYSHGFVRKKNFGQTTKIVGKRVYCSNRYNKNGCGRTFQLYLADFMPALHYSCFEFETNLAHFLCLKTTDLTRNSYRKCHSRTCFRWVRKIRKCLPRLREKLLRLNSELLDATGESTTALKSTLLNMMFFSLSSFQALTQAPIL